MELTRRSFFAGIAAALAAPVIVRATSIMPIKMPTLILPPDFDLGAAIGYRRDLLSVIDIPGIGPSSDGELDRDMLDKVIRAFMV